jgi:hypothetical protein
MNGLMTNFREWNRLQTVNCFRGTIVYLQNIYGIQLPLQICLEDSEMPPPPVCSHLLIKDNLIKNGFNTFCWTKII